jgi:hypothetical protein
VTRDTDRCPDLDPDRACARDWHPVEAPERRPEPKYKDEPVQWSSPAADDASGPGPDPAARAHHTQERDYAERPDRGDVEPNVGGRDG